MKPRKTREISAGLQSKGFKTRESNHTFFILYVSGKKTAIRTKLSHGASEYSSALLAQMAKQLRLSGNEFGELIDCPLAYQEYVSLLEERGHLKASSVEAPSACSPNPPDKESKL